MERTGDGRVRPGSQRRERGRGSRGRVSCKGGGAAGGSHSNWDRSPNTALAPAEKS